MAAHRPAADSGPLLRPTPNELAVVPPLGVLAALDATLATAVYQLHVEHPDLGLENLARGDLPSSAARKASLLAFRFTDLRAAIRDYRDIALAAFVPDDDQLNLPF